MGAEAAHIFPHAVLNMNRWHALYLSILGDAGLLRGNMTGRVTDSFCVGSHHKTIAAEVPMDWTFEPDTMAIDVRSGERGDLLVLVGPQLDCSHQPEPRWQPTGSGRVL